MDRYLVRQAGMGDFEALSNVLAECDRLHSLQFPDLFTPPYGGIARSREYIQGLLDDSNALVLVAEQEGMVVGALITILREAAPLPILVHRRFAVIDVISVKEQLRGSGIGSALMQAAEDWAAGKGAGSIELGVFLFNQTAVRFYEMLGYQPITQKMRKVFTGGRNERNQ